MKSLTEIKDKIAQQHGYKDFMDVLKSFDCAKSTYTEVNFIINEAMNIHAQQCCDEQIKACAEKASENILINSTTILSTPNVAEKP